MRQVICMLMAGWVSLAAQAEIILLATAEQQPVTWRYTTDSPGLDWTMPEFDDAGWESGPAGFGTKETPGARVGTTWKTGSIYLRKTFDYDGQSFRRGVLHMNFDENIKVFLNGQRIVDFPGYTTEYGHMDATYVLRELLREGENTLAVQCGQTVGGQYVDVGVILDPPPNEQIKLRMLNNQPATPRAMEKYTGPLPPIEPLFDVPLRDTSVCLGGDGMYYLTGTTAAEGNAHTGLGGWWYVNEGLRIWKSADLKTWEPLGVVWSLDEDATWAAEFKDDGIGYKRRALWAPEIHYMKGTFWVTYSMNYFGNGFGCGLLKSTSGKAEGPYVDVKTDGPLTDKIDASLFQDDDGTVYWLYQNGMIARMNDDMTDLAEEPKHLQPADFYHIGFEGAFLFKRDGRYYLSCADFLNGQYSCLMAESDNLYGPYGPSYLAIPHGGHNVFFTDKEGQMWSTFFGHNTLAPVTQRPAILKIEFDEDGHVRPKL